MKNFLRIITSEKQHSFIGFERDLCVGSFNHSNSHGFGYNVYSLDSFDEKYIESQNIKLKPAEFIFRADTEKSQLTGIKFLVKINLVKGLVYFNNADSESGDLVFETRGSKINYLNFKAEYFKGTQEIQNCDFSNHFLEII